MKGSTAKRRRSARLSAAEALRGRSERTSEQRETDEKARLGLLNSSVSLALSGGGHRAAVFELGVMMYLVDAQMSKHVTSIASVSGGGIANGFTAAQVNFATTTPDEFTHRVVSPLIRKIAHTGTATLPYITKAYLYLCAVLALCTFLPFFFPQPTLLAVLEAIAISLLFGYAFGFRSDVCQYAFRKNLFMRNGKPLLLADLYNGAVSHIFCSTDLQTGHMFYMSDRFIYGYKYGHSEDAVDVVQASTAVAASAAFPGAQNALSMNIRDFKFSDAIEDSSKCSKHLFLADGGVYDNLSSDWARRFALRSQHWPGLGNLCEAPTSLIVVNAGLPPNFDPLKRYHIPLFGELAAYVRGFEVTYYSNLSTRIPSILSGKIHANDDFGNLLELPASLIQIYQSPFEIADLTIKCTSTSWRSRDRVRRAEAVLEHLGEKSRATWDAVVEQTCRVKSSVFPGISVDDTASLLYQGYTVAMCNLHVAFDYPLLPLSPRQRFVDIYHEKSKQE